jgi:hypothetical protein
MMKIKITLTFILIASIFAMSLPSNIYAQQNIDQFWVKFKNAVTKSDKNAVANMTNFPLSMPYGVKTVKTKADFIKRYDKILNMEADAKRCFEARSVEKEENSKRYFINCTFKGEPESSDNRPIYYYFEKTKSGWKFTGLDNINE